MKRRGQIRLKKKLAAWKAAKFNAMRAVATNSVNFFKVTVFDAQGWIDRTVQRWEPRKPAKTVKESARAGRKILVDTGAGRQSIHAAVITEKQVVIRAEAEYMNYHNTGTKNLPQRKFLGKSSRLDKQNLETFKRSLSRAMKA